MFVLKTASAAYAQIHFMKENNMNPDQTATPSISFAIKATNEHKQTTGADGRSRDWWAKC